MFLISLIGKAGKIKPPFCSVVIVAAGSSRRMDGEDKLFAEILGVPVLAHTLAAFQICEGIGEIIVVVRKEALERVSRICMEHGITKASSIIVGGQTRLLSVINGVFAVSKKAKLIAIHDGARPCVSQEVIIRTLQAAAKYHAAAPAVPVGFTVKKVRDHSIIETVDRGELFEVQTPQIFDANLIKAALTNAVNKSIEVTDDCMAVEAIGASVHVSEGSRHNIKLTTSEDIVIAEAILRRARN